MKHCCVETFGTMDHRVRSMHVAERVLAASPFVALFGAHAPDALDGIATNLTIDQALERIVDMKRPMVAQAIGDLDVLIRSLLRDDAVMHALEHYKDERLYRFWARVADRYS